MNKFALYDDPLVEETNDLIEQYLTLIIGNYKDGKLSLETVTNYFGVLTDTYSDFGAQDTASKDAFYEYFTTEMGLTANEAKTILWSWRPWA